MFLSCISMWLLPWIPIFGRYIIQDQVFSGIGIGNGALNATQALAEGSFVDIPGRTHQVGIDYTRTFTPAFVNQARISYSHARAFFEGGAFGNCVERVPAIKPVSRNCSTRPLSSFHGRAGSQRRPKFNMRRLLMR